MQILSIVLAFTLLMVAFSTIASGIAEIILRLFAIRARNLRSILKTYIDDELLPNIEQALAADGKTIPREATPVAILDHLAKNRLGGAWTLKLGKYQLITIGQWIDALSTEAYFERLGKWEPARALLDGAEEKVQARITDLSLSFERYMAAGSEVFRKEANAVAFVVAILLAFVGNIDLGRVINYLRANPDVVERINEREADILASAEALLIEGDDEEKQVSENGLETEEFLAALEDLRSRIAEVDALTGDYALPIGWAYYPFNIEAPAETGEGASATEPVEGESGWQIRSRPAGDFLKWAINALVAGLLIGLGAPFWYRVLQSVARATSFGNALGLRQEETVGAPKVGHDETVIERTKTHLALLQASSQRDLAPATRSTGSSGKTS